jgi:hypothetical protein
MNLGIQELWLKNLQSEFQKPKSNFGAFAPWRES